MLSISIIIPIYGVEQHIERCLRSVMRQDYSGMIECILIDDCSPDKSMEIAETILSNYTGHVKFQIIRHPYNKGLSAARNSGINNAHGDYIFFLDSDDEMTANAVTVLAAEVEKNPGVDIVFGDWYVSYMHRFLQNEKGIPSFITDREKICRVLLKGDLATTAQNKLLRRNYIVENKLFFYEGIIQEDMHYSCYLAKTAHSIAVTYVPTYIYYVNPKGITSVYTDKNVRSICLFVEDVLNSDLSNFEGPELIYCYTALQGAYYSNANKELLPLLKSTLKTLAFKAKLNKAYWLFLHVNFVTTCSYKYFKRFRMSYLYRAINGIMYRYYMNSFSK